MITPPKGQFDALTLNAEGRRVGNTWDPDRDEKAGEQCKAYGAPAIMLLPGRIHITWEDPNTLKLEFDGHGNPDPAISFRPNGSGSTDLAGTFGGRLAIWPFHPRRCPHR